MTYYDKLKKVLAIIDQRELLAKQEGLADTVHEMSVIKLEIKKALEEPKPLPCPFCGHEIISVTGLPWAARCLDCDSAGPKHHDVNAAVVLWNKAPRKKEE